MLCSNGSDLNAVDFDYDVGRWIFNWYSCFRKNVHMKIFIRKAAIFFALDKNMVKLFFTIKRIKMKINQT